jgi:plasmid stabilization system protein ParE
MKLTVQPEANGDVTEAMSWFVAQLRLETAGRLWRLWTAGLDAIESNPWAYPMVEDWRSADPSIRNYLLPRYGYRIIYQVKQDGVLVVAFARGRRKPGHGIDRLTEAP